MRGLLYYRAEKKSWQILLSRTQAGPGRKVKQEQEEISRNLVPRLLLSSVNRKIAKQETIPKSRVSCTLYEIVHRIEIMRPAPRFLNNTE